jgi:hypothetical protein
MYPHPALSEWQVEQIFADAAQRATPSRCSTDVPLLDRLGSLGQALRSRVGPRASRRAAVPNARACPHAGA